MLQSIREFVSPDFAPGVIAPATRYPGSILRRPGGAVGAAVTLIVVVTAMSAPFLATSDPFMISGPALSPPSHLHPMGTDGLGRDLMSGILHGAGTSLMIAVLVGLIALVVGVVIGVVAGYRGGIVDDALMRFTEMFQVLPRFFLIAVVLALFGPGTDRVILAMGITSWPLLARVVRAEVIAIRHLEFVLAAEALGASQLRVFVRVLIPQMAPSILVMLGLLFGQVLLLEASLGFLGLGDPAVMTWGMLAGQAQQFLRVAWWLSFFPGMAIMLTVMGFNLLSDALSTPRHSR